MEKKVVRVRVFEDDRKFINESRVGEETQEEIVSRLFKKLVNKK